VLTVAPAGSDWANETSATTADDAEEMFPPSPSFTGVSGAETLETMFKPTPEGEDCSFAGSCVSVTSCASSSPRLLRFLPFLGAETSALAPTLTSAPETEEEAPESVVAVLGGCWPTLRAVEERLEGRRGIFQKQNLNFHDKTIVKIEGKNNKQSRKKKFVYDEGGVSQSKKIAKSMSRKLATLYDELLFS
jgi:hypothetical protein